MAELTAEHVLEKLFNLGPLPSQKSGLMPRSVEESATNLQMKMENSVANCEELHARYAQIKVPLPSSFLQSISRIILDFGVKNRGRENEGNFHFKNFSRAFKWLVKTLPPWSTLPWILSIPGPFSASQSYVSLVRSYASYPKDVRHIFSFKALHLGHIAKSFALRDPPNKITGIGKGNWVRKEEVGHLYVIWIQQFLGFVGKLTYLMFIALIYCKCHF